MSKTTLLTFDNEICDPGKWTVVDVLNIASVVRFGNLGAARLPAGVRLVSSEHLEPIGGTIEHIGYTDCVDHKDIANYETLQDMDYEPGKVLPVMPVYRGQTKYLVCVAVDNGDGGQDYEFELKDTAEEAEALNREIYERF